MEESICCGAVRLWDTDLCSQCGEWSEFEVVDEENNDHFNHRANECLKEFMDKNKQDHE